MNEALSYDNKPVVVPTGDDTSTVRVVHLGSSRRKYLPTLAELIDRLAIVQLKAIYISGHRGEYLEEMSAIEHDIGLILDEKEREGHRIGSAEVRAILAIAITNHAIWTNEAKARQGGNEQDHLLKLTHSINGQRNAAKNRISARFNGERFDYKVDCFAAELPLELGNWRLFGDL